MSFKGKYDFCLINEGYSKNSKNIIFITAKGLDYIDETITHDTEYREIKKMLKNLNFYEIEYCSFEALSDMSYEEEERIIEKLVGRGINYSKSLEIKISSQLRSLKKNENLDPFQIYFETPNQTPKHKLLTYGEKIPLYFYLFLECHFINDEDCFLNLSGDFFSKENNNYRNYIGISSSDFVCIESVVPNIITLQSTKNFKDFVKETNILHNGKFRLVKPFITEVGQKVEQYKEYQYNFIEIKKNINPEGSIALQVNTNGFYDKMMEKSEEIKKEFLNTKESPVSIDFIKSEISYIKTKLENKMLTWAEIDEYERANYFKDNINILDNKLNIINNIVEKNISLEEYMKIFTLD